jgi:hypothetical protein
LKLKGDNKLSGILKIEDSTSEIIKKMSQMASGSYNSGATVVMIDMIKQGQFIDPDSWAGGLSSILLMDGWDIRGEKIWMLYKDVCKEDMVKTIGLLRACQMGIINQAALITAIMNCGQGVDVDDCLTKLQEKLPNFNPNMATV